MRSPATSRMLTDHTEIRRWAEQRRARPAAVRSPFSDDYIGMIRLDFPGYRGEDSLAEISWDEWFEDFDDRNLALVVHDQAADGQPSIFHKLVRRETLEKDSAETSSGKRGGNGTRPASGRTSGSQTPNKIRARGGSSRIASSGFRAEKKTAEHSRSSRPKAA
jgi:hypothetical protein